jgi:hypothetical protein
MSSTLFLQNQRTALVQNQQEPGLTTEIPRSLTQRFEIILIPRSIIKPKKLREIKSIGMVHVHPLNNYYSLNNLNIQILDT